MLSVAGRLATQRDSWRRSELATCHGIHQLPKYIRGKISFMSSGTKRSRKVEMIIHSCWAELFTLARFFVLFCCSRFYSPGLHNTALRNVWLHVYRRSLGGLYTLRFSTLLTCSAYGSRHPPLFCITSCHLLIKIFPKRWMPLLQIDCKCSKLGKQ